MDVRGVIENKWLFIGVVELIEFVYGEGGGMIEWVYGCEGSDRK